MTDRENFFKQPRINKPGESIPQEVLEEVWERCKGRCEYCGKPAVDPHHIIYRSHGGSNLANNIIALCRRCHENILILKIIAENPLRYIGRYEW